MTRPETVTYIPPPTTPAEQALRAAQDRRVQAIALLEMARLAVAESEADVACCQGRLLRERRRERARLEVVL